MLLNTTEVVYQTLGIAALVIYVLCFQFKNNRTFLLIQTCSSILFTIQFLIGHAWAALIMNAICVVRCFSLALINKKAPKICLTIIFSFAYVIGILASILIFDEKIFIAILCGLASIVGTIMYCIGNQKLTRYMQFSFQSPCWLVNNFYYMTIGGIVAELLTMVSSITALVRWKIQENKINI